MKTLHVLNVHRLQNLEVGQHVKSVLKAIEDLGSGFVTNDILLNYLSQINTAVTAYDKAMLKVVKSDETVKIADADAERDKSITATQRYLSVFELSKEAAEREAFASLHTLMKTYKNIQKWNFEEESNGIDNLLEDFASEHYAPHVAMLHLESFVERIRTDNEAFKAVFALRTHQYITTEHFDAKVLRDDLVAKYNLLCDYVLAMATALDNEEFNTVLNALNTIRKYYADLLARRQGTGKTEPVEDIPPVE